MELQLRISGFHYEKLKKHLFPSDGKESIAVALCGRFSDKGLDVLLIHDIIFINDDECLIREHDQLCWPTQKVIKYFERIGKSDMGILKIHSHPNGFNKFSRTDDKSDQEFFDSVFGWAINNKPHASAIMLPDGSIFGRFYFQDLTNIVIDKITIAGDNLIIIRNFTPQINDRFSLRTIQAFGERTYSILKNLTVGVVGCSGTGSPVIEQLVRLGIGKLVLIDPDCVEEKNLNRIINSTYNDSKLQIPKVDMLANAINKIGFGTEVETFQVNLYDSIPALKALGKCDAVFGCIDSVDGRYILNQLSTFYLLPYFDLGVKLEADDKGGINKICCSVHYIQPGKSSLITRGLYNMDDLRAASQLRKNPKEYESLKKNSYIKNVNVNNPAVISVNMQISSHAINEFLNRIHPYKSESSENYSLSTIDLTENCIVNVSENDFELDEYLKRKTGRGDISPFLEITDLVK